jgi:parvulin-like peptidyl-prolyl isomerase
MFKSNSIFFRTIKSLPISLLILIQVNAYAQSSDPVVIELADTKVGLSEFEATFKVSVRMLAAQQGIPLGNQDESVIDRLRSQYLGQRANELAMVQEATKRGIAIAEPSVLAQAAEIREKILSDTSITEPLDDLRLLALLRDKQMVATLSEQLLEEIVVRPGDVVVLHHDIQDEIKKPEQICLRQIVVDEETTANQLLAELEKGGDFIELATQHSTDSKTAQKGGDMGCFSREGQIARSDFERAAFAASLNELEGPVKSDFGYHLLTVYKKIPAHIPSLNEVFDELKKELRHERLPGKLMEITENSGVKIYPEYLNQE